MGGLEEQQLSKEQLDSFERDGFLILPAISDEISRSIVDWSNTVKVRCRQDGLGKLEAYRA